MMKTVYYSERQRFNQWWVWGSAFLGPVLLFLPLLGLILSGSSYIVLLLIFILTFWLPIFLYCIHLDTEVNEFERIIYLENGERISRNLILAADGSN